MSRTDGASVRSKKRTEFEAAREQLTERLKDRPSEQRDEWLRTLYENYTQRFISDNERIWTTGAIMIPLSLSGFVALTAIEQVKTVHLVFLAAASFLVILVWLIIAENHRAFQQRALVWTEAIECVLGLEGACKSKVRGGFLNRLLTFSGAVQFVRWGLTGLVLTGWVIVLLCWPRT